jgi:hypothetical protein
MDFGPIPPPQPERRKRGFWRGLKFLLGGPFSTFGTEHIARNAAVIGSLAERLKQGPRTDGRVHVDDDRRLDLAAMARRAGVSVAAIEIQLANRRRQTARAVLCYLAGGVGFPAFWFLEAISTPSFTRLAYVGGLLLICTAFFLSAFYNALVNWQIRTLRLGTAREFLCTDESWWPS